MASFIIDLIKVNGTDATSGPCFDADNYISAALIGVNVLLIIANRMLTFSETNWLAPFNIEPFTYIGYYFWVLYVKPIFSDQINLSYVNYVPIGVAGVLSLVTCASVLGEPLLAFTISMYTFASYGILTSVIIAASISIAVILLTRFEKLKRLTRDTVFFVTFSFGFLMSFMARVLPITTCRSYFIVCNINCPVIAMETSEFTVGYIIASAAIVSVAFAIGTYLKYCCQKRKERNELKKLGNKLDQINKEKAKQIELTLAPPQHPQIPSSTSNVIGGKHRYILVDHDYDQY